VLRTLGSIEAPDEKSAVGQAAKLFNIPPVLSQEAPLRKQDLQ